MLSLLLCAAGTSTQKLVVSYNVDIPAFQAFLNYFLLSVVFSTKFFFKGYRAIQILRKYWWMVIIGAIDVGGNYLVYKAYQYTSLTSVQVSY